MTTRVAVFVDGENVASDHAAAIAAVGRSHGTVDILRVYGNAANMTRWSKVESFRLIHTGTGKNATDLLLTIDAMEFALSGRLGTIIIASSDRDFSHLATRLREHGLTVIGIGEPKSPKKLRAVCSGFTVLGTAASKPIASTTPSAPVTKLDFQIRDEIAANSKNGNGMRIADLAPIMHQKHKIRISELPERTWRRYLSNRAALYDLDAKGPDSKVRFKKEGFASEG